MRQAIVPVIFIGVLAAITYGIALLSRRRWLKDADREGQVAQQHGLRFYPYVQPKPDFPFPGMRQSSAVVTKVMLDPGTSDIAFRQDWAEPSVVRGNYKQHEDSGAIVCSGIWLEDWVIIAEPSALGRRSTRLGMEAFDRQYRIAGDGDLALQMLNPAAANFLVHNPPPTKKSKFFFLGPWLMLKCPAHGVQQRIEMLRYLQRFRDFLAVEGAPGYGAYTLEVGPATDTSLPAVTSRLTPTGAANAGIDLAAPDRSYMGDLGSASFRLANVSSRRRRGP